MRILASANGIQTTTGYGTQLRKILKVFQELGHEVAVQCFYGVQGGMLTIEGIPHYCNLRDMWSQDVIGQTVQHFGADAVFTLFDAWVLGPGYQQKAGVPWICYSPIDSEPANPITVERMREARFPVVYSKFGLEQMNQTGVRCDYVPHMIDTQIFKPGDKVEARKHLGLPESGFMVSMVAANKGYPSRKAFPEQLSAFAEFYKTHPDSFLFLHTMKTPVGGWSDGIYFDPLLRDLGIHDKGCVYFSNEYLSAQGLFTEEDVAKVYQASDVLMSASYAEGFGLPLLESQACGCPVITTNFSSMPELTLNGITTPPLSREWSLLGCWQVSPNPSVIAQWLIDLYPGSAWARTEMDGQYAIEKIQAEYSCEAVKPLWKALLDKVEAEVSEIKGLTRLQSVSTVPEDLSGYFDHIANTVTVTDHLYKHEHDKQRFKDVIEAVSKFSPIESLLEVGCCEGAMTTALAPLAKSVKGIDYSPVVIERCPEIPNVTFELLDVEKEPILDTYDVIVISEVLEHLRNPQAVIAKLLSQCRTLIATCPITEPLNENHAFDASTIGHESRQGDGTGHIWAMNMDGFKKMFEGQTILDARPIGQNVSGLIIAQGHIAEAVGAD